MATIEPMAKAKPKATAQYLPLGLPSVELWMLPTQGHSPVGICGSLPGFVAHEAIHCSGPVTAVGPVPPYLSIVEDTMLTLRKTGIILPMRSFDLSA